MYCDEGFIKQMNLSVVVADDSASFLEKLVSILEVEFEVLKTAMDGKSALEIIINCHPDVVVLDLEMPGMDGIEITRELMKCNPRSAKG